jgi:hypothetical protein
MPPDISYVNDTTRENPSPTHPQAHVGYVNDHPKTTLDNRRSVGGVTFAATGRRVGSGNDVVMDSEFRSTGPKHRRVCSHPQISADEQGHRECFGAQNVELPTNAKRKHYRHDDTRVQETNVVRQVL